MKTPATPGSALAALAALLSTALVPPCASAASIGFDDPDLKLNWDTTVKLSNAWRLKRPAAGLLADPNQDDGNRNLGRGLVSNRLDLFSEADLQYRQVGLRVSAAGWYDTVYQRGNDNDSPGTSNNASVAANRFTAGTRQTAGRQAELLDAFVFAKATVGAVPVNLRIGRHALQWGESLFFGNNGIAGAMAPLDIVKAAAVPNSLVREIIRPVGQVSGTAELTPSLSAAAYVQYRWDKTRLPPAGSYFSAGDILDDGGECLRFVAGPPCGTPGASLLRGPDQKARDSGQWGVKLKYSDKSSGVDYGLYLLRFHSKTPAVYLNTALVPGGPPVPVPVSYQLVYPQGIRLIGASVAFTAGDFQWSGEVSTRRNTPLNGAAPPVGPGADNGANPQYPVGHTAHAQVSLLATLPSNAIAKSSSLLAEVAWNRTLSVTRNAAAVFPNTSRDGLSMRVVFAPNYNQVVDGLDISVPIGLGYSPMAKASAVPSFGVRHGGDMSVGVSGTYLGRWQFAVNLQHFFGPAGLTQDAQGLPTFKQAFKDRDFLSLSASTTF